MPPVYPLYSPWSPPALNTPAGGLWLGWFAVLRGQGRRVRKSAPAAQRNDSRLLQAQLGQLGFKRHLERLHIGGGRTIAGLWRNQAKLTGLIELPGGGGAVAERDLAAYHGAGPRDLVHGKRDLARTAGGLTRF